MYILNQHNKISTYFNFQEIAPIKKYFFLTGGFLFARAKGLLCPQYESLCMWSIKEGAYEAEFTTQQSVFENKRVLSKKTVR